MAHFYGTLKGSRGEVTRTGTKNSGMETYCASWKGAVRCVAYVNEVDGKEIDCVRVERVFWKGAGKYRLLYEGPIGGKK